MSITCFNHLKFSTTVSVQEIMNKLTNNEVWFGNKETIDISDLPDRVSEVHLESCDDIKCFPNCIKNKLGQLTIYYKNDKVHNNIINWPSFKVIKDEPAIEFDELCNKIVVVNVKFNEEYMDNL